MNQSDLQKLTQSQLIALLLENAATQPIPKPRKSVKLMVQDYEDNIILPPLEFRDGHKQFQLQEPNRLSKSLFHFQERK